YQQLLAQHSNKIIVVYNKADIAPARLATNGATSELTKSIFIPNSAPALEVSSTTGHNLVELERRLNTKIASLLAQSDSPFMLNGRQFNLLLGVEKKLLEIQPMLQGSVQYELLSYHLNDA